MYDCVYKHLDSLSDTSSQIFDLFLYLFGMFWPFLILNPLKDMCEQLLIRGTQRQFSEEYLLGRRFKI